MTLMDEFDFISEPILAIARTFHEANLLAELKEALLSAFMAGAAEAVTRKAADVAADLEQFRLERRTRKEMVQ